MPTVSWKSSVNGSWTDKADWSSGAVPAAVDDVLVDTSTPITITHGKGTNTVLSLTIDDGTLQMSGGLLKVLGDTTIFGALNETGAKTMLVLGGLTSDLSGMVMQTAGTIDVASGLLDLRGTGDTFQGAITGADVSFSSGSDTLGPGFTLGTASAVVAGASLTLGAKLAYAGAWSQTAGVVSLSGRTLTLSGAARFTGGQILGAGSVAIGKSASISNLEIEGAATLDNRGSVDVSGSLSLFANSAGTPNFVNESGARLSIEGGISGGSGVTLDNAGSMTVTGNTFQTSVSVATINAGNVQIGSGTVEFLDAVTGTGNFMLDAGSTLQFQSSVASGGTVSMGAFTDLLVRSVAAFGGGFGATIGGFAKGDVIVATDLSAGSTTLSFNAAHDRLTLTEGSTTASLQLTGSYQASSFFLFSDNGSAAIGHT